MAGHVGVLPAGYSAHAHDGALHRTGHFWPANGGVREQSDEDFVTRTERSRARAVEQYRQPQAAAEQPPKRQLGDPGLNRWTLRAPATDPGAAVESRPEGPARRAAAMPAPSGVPSHPPRPSSSGDASVASSTVATMTAATIKTRGGFDARGMHGPSSWNGGQTSFESFRSALQPGPARGAYSQAWQRPAPLKQRRRRPGELFAALPGEVLELILDELKKLHLAPGSTSCATCWMRDACSVAVSARKWLKFARGALYSDVILVGADSATHRKRFKGVVGTRMVLLRRTLRAVPLLAAMVRALKVPATAPSGVPADEYLNVVATLVMAMPNLERVVGFYPPYDHSFGRFFHALSTRRRLREMTWILQPSPFQRQHRLRQPPAAAGGREDVPAQGQGQHPSHRDLLTGMGDPGEIQPQQTIRWIENHAGWQHLTHLNIHCEPGATLTPDTLLVDTLAALPCLRALYLSHLPANAFNDACLQSLPPLKRLSLVHLAGVSSAGLSAFATRATSRALASLTLVQVNVDSLPALARMLSNLGALASLSLVQSYPPALPAGEVIWLFPYLASASLARLHWDVPAPPLGRAAAAADSILARSIAAGGFPSLRRLRAPADPDGLFQALCRPREKVELPGDRYRHHGAQRHQPRQHSLGSFGGAAHSRSSSAVGPPPSEAAPKRAAAASLSPPASPRFPVETDLEPRPSSDLRLARLAAQARLEAARQHPRFLVNVVGDDGSLAANFGLAGYIGEVGSPIEYHLLPDAGGRDESGGLVGVADLVGNDDDEKEGCQGRWNTFGGLAVDKKDKERWFHVERGRFRAVTLS